MFQTRKKIESKIQIINEMQNYIILNRYFIRELEEAGGDTRTLKEELKEMENKIQTLRLQYGENY